MAKKTVEPEKPKETEKAAADTPAEAPAEPAAEAAVPDVVDDDEARRVYGEKAAAPRRTPASPAAMPAHSVGHRRAAAAAS